MAINHQYSANSVIYSGATEITHEPTWITGIYEGANHNPIILVRRGSIVTISGIMFLNSSISQGNDLAFVPQEFRPIKTAVIMGKTTTTNLDVVFNVNPSGSIFNDSRGLADYFHINGSYCIK